MKIIKFLILSCFAITGCSKDELIHPISGTSNTNEIKHSYSEISNYKVSWNDVFFIAKPQYFVYFYSLSCSHCNELKNSVIEYALNRENIYFCENSKDVIISENIANTIGISDVSKLSILGFPSLIKIEDNKLLCNIAGIDKIKLELKI
ncbi:MAG TPA: hypothetical protein DDW20_05260 [Firmicutes bacterium]|nr:hypothetical protein [Bacillota bacterium]